MLIEVDRDLKMLCEKDLKVMLTNRKAEIEYAPDCKRVGVCLAYLSENYESFM